jgi:predicted butyrate kinase (DUF1464 family)
MLRVAGTDPGTSSLDVLVLEDGAVRDQARFAAEQVQADPTQPVRWLEERGPYAVIAGPSGYGLPPCALRDASDDELSLMMLVRPEERGRQQGVRGFSALLAALRASSLPVMCLPGVIHLPTVPAHRKVNRIDLGTADKVAVAALALHQHAVTHGLDLAQCHFLVVELGSVFSACLAIHAGCIVDGVGGTSGPVGWGSGGAWDGEAAYWRGPLSKADLFTGGAGSIADPDVGRRLFVESLVKAVAALQAVTPLPELVLSGRLLQTQPEVVAEVERALQRFGRVVRLAPLAGAWVKHAAQGAALLADGLAGGQHANLVNQLRLRAASGTVLDWLPHEP